ncbi:hypothetical protein D9M69_734970 [compost metagenome]
MCALIVVLNVDKDLLDQLEIGPLGPKDDCRRLGIAADGTQRLVEFVGNRRGERAGGRGLVEMNHLEETMA